MTSHASRVLSAILNKEYPRNDLLGMAVVRLDKEHFAADTERSIFTLLVRYYDRTGEVMPQETFTKALEDGGWDASKVLAFTKTYESLASNPVTEADFKWSVDELRAEAAKRQTRVAITESVEIIERGYVDPKGRKFTGDADARAYLLERLSDIDRLENTETAPEGNVFIETKEIWQEYLDRKEGRVSKGLPLGIRALDDRTDGLQRGELIIICAYAGMGKSMISTQCAWNTAVMEKQNVFFATSETLRNQVTRRILARHSMLPIFDHPINSADIKRGTLSAADEKVFQDVLEDWRYNSEYGEINVVQVPPGSKLSYADNRMRDYGKEKAVGLCVIDYFALFKSETKRNSEREEFNEIIRTGKGMAQGAFDGLGVPLISPWQVTRDAYDHAMRTGYYTKASLSDTSEAEKSADQILAIIREDGNNTDMALQYLKMRDDEIPPITQVSIDLRHAYIGAHVGPLTLGAGSANNDDLLLSYT